MAEPRAAGGPLAGELIELEVGAVAHGGCCVARHDGRVVFVRHALSGERVRARVTEDRGGAYCRADAVEVLRAAPQRVRPPCPHAGPGRCGGCDWQHASPALQRRLKGEVVREQFRRLASLDVAQLCGDAEALPGGSLGWRTRIAFAIGPDGRPGLRRHRSHEVEQLARCPLGVPGVGDAAALRRRWPGVTAIEPVCGVDGAVSLLAHRPGRGRQPRGRRPPDRVEVIAGPAQGRHRLGGREFVTAADGFWQVHPDAAATFAAAVLAALGPTAGERVLDLYCGAGALTAALADAVGPAGLVLGVDGSRQAITDAAQNLRELPWVQLRHARLNPSTIAALGVDPDLIVLDPPRAGAGPAVMTELLALSPRAIGYLACDPAALARDVRVALEAGWQLSQLRVFDAFPMTHHVECFARLEPGTAAS